MNPAKLYRQLSENIVECTACAWHCRIRPEQTGICATRINRSGKLYSLVYGHPTGLELDPVEKKPLHHFLPGSTVFSFGTVGCNYGCLFCQNAWMSQINKISNPPTGGQSPISKQTEKIQGIIDQLSISITPAEIVEKALRIGAQSIAYTYNEPTIFAEFAHDTAVIARKNGLKNVFVTNGYQSTEVFDYLAPYLDAVNIDLKSFREDFYRDICKASVMPVKENIKRFFDTGIETEVTTLIIPGKNDGIEEITEIALFIKSVSPDIPWHLSAFHPDWRMPDVPETPLRILTDAYEIGKKAGLHYVYVGNIMDDKRAATYCPECGSTLISRRGYDSINVNLDFISGTCRKCGMHIYGIFH